jgi:anti-sigma factor RsiW
VSSQHLSDEALAAFADGVLSGHARERATRHTAGCPECAHAVAVQREAVWALRAAPAPALPTGLLDRLRSVPTTTPINVVPSTIAPDGSAMFAAFGTMTSAAFVPPRRGVAHAKRVRPIVMTAAAVAAVGIFAVSSTGQASAQKWKPIRSGPGTVVPAGFFQHNVGAPAGRPGH